MKNLIITSFSSLIFIVTAVGLTVIQLYSYATATSFYLMYVSTAVFEKAMINAIFISTSLLSLSVTILALAPIYSLFKKILNKLTFPKELNPSIIQYLIKHEIFTQKNNTYNIQSLTKLTLHKPYLSIIKKEHISHYFSLLIALLSLFSIFIIQVFVYMYCAGYIIIYKTSINTNESIFYYLLCLSTIPAFCVARLAFEPILKIFLKASNKIADPEKPKTT